MFGLALLVVWAPCFALRGQPASTAPTAAPAPESSSAATNVVGPLTMDSLDDNAKLAPGDRVSFRILEDKEPPMVVQVADDGRLELPFGLGRFKIKDLTCKEAARQIKQFLEIDYYNTATVIVSIDAARRSQSLITLTGAVARPGPMPLPDTGDFTLIKAIDSAGGFTRFADRKRVEVSRRKDPGGTEYETIRVNVADIQETGKFEKDIILQPDDRITVREKAINF